MLRHGWLSKTVAITRRGNRSLSCVSGDQPHTLNLEHKPGLSHRVEGISNSHDPPASGKIDKMSDRGLSGRQN